MKQTVTIIRTADRHANLHDRDFAEAREVTVPSDSLDRVIQSALDELPDMAPGRYVVLVDWPHEEEQS